jgi:hypothetical protein
MLAQATTLMYENVEAERHTDEEQRCRTERPVNAGITNAFSASRRDARTNQNKQIYEHGSERNSKREDNHRGKQKHK